MSVAGYQIGADSTQPDEPPRTCAANPVDVANGLKLQHEQDVPGRIEFTRYFRTNNTNGVLGKTWRHTYQRSLSYQAQWEERKHSSNTYTTKAQACVHGWASERPTDDWAAGTSASYDEAAETCRVTKGATFVKTVPIVTSPIHILHPAQATLTRADGTQLRFQPSADGWLAAGAYDGELLQLPDGAWQFITAERTIEHYDADGRLLTLTDRDGFVRTLAYDADGVLTSVLGPDGEGLHFEYSGTTLSAVTAPGYGRQTYHYDTQGRLERIERADGASRRYHYEDASYPTRLTGISDERGVRYASWTYDTVGRAISSQHAGGADDTRLAFNADGSTTVTNPLGKATTYHFDEVAGARRVVRVEGEPTANCIGTNQTYTYTAQGRIASKSDWQGVVTTYSYDARGLETSRTEAVGTPEERTITTEWDPTHHVPLRITEPGRVITYTYDAEGRELSRTETETP